MSKLGRIKQASKCRTSRPARSFGTRRSCEENEAIVLDALAQADHPLGAYDIVAYSSSTGQKIVPTQVYRTLARLIEKQLVSRIEAMCAYTLKERSNDICLIDKSSDVIKWVSAPKIVDRLHRLAKASGFTPGRAIIEVYGQFDTRH